MTITGYLTINSFRFGLVVVLDYNSGKIPQWIGFFNGLFVNSFVYYKRTTLTGTTAPGQSGPESNDN